MSLASFEADSTQEVQRPSIISEGVPCAVFSLTGARPRPISCGGAEGSREVVLRGFDLTCLILPCPQAFAWPIRSRVCATVSYHSDVSDLQRRSLTPAAMAKVTRKQLVAQTR